MGRLSREKGRRYELAVARRLREAGFDTALRTLTEVRDGNVGDVSCSGPFCLQAKIGAEPPVWRAVREAEAAATDGRYAVAFVKRNQGRGRPPQEIVAMPADQWLEIAATLRKEKVW